MNKKEQQYSSMQGDWVFNLIDTAMDAIISVDKHQRIKIFNAAATEMFGYQKEEVYNKHLDILIPIRYRGMHSSYVQNFGETGQTKRRMGGASIIYGLKKSGSTFPIEASISKVKDEKDVFFTVILRDISKRLETQKALKESEQKFKDISLSLGDWVWELNSSFELVFSAGPVERLLGFTHEELLHKRPMDILSPRDKEQLLEQLITHLEQGKAINNWTTWVEKKNGQVILLESNGQALMTNDEEVIGFRGVSRDITETWQYKSKLQLTAEELDVFMYKASHNLKGPISSILGLIEVFKNELRQQEALSSFTPMLQERAQHLKEVIDELIDITRLRQEIVPLKPVDLIKFVQTNFSEPLLSYQIDGAFKVTYSPEGNFVVYGEEEALKNIFQNLIENAVVFRSVNKALEIELSFREEKDKVIVYFADNGTGISEDLKEKVFTMFYRGDSRSKGAGLGLYIVKTAVDKLEGEVYLEPKCSLGGCAFSMSFPKVQNPD